MYNRHQLKEGVTGSRRQLKEGVAGGRGAIILAAVGPPPADEASSFLSAVGDTSSYSTFIFSRASLCSG